MGFDIMVSVIILVFYYFMKNFRIYWKFRDEIDMVVVEGWISLFGRVRYVNVVKLFYFDVCCKEGMRVYVSFGLLFLWYIFKEGVEFLGEFFFFGVKVGCNF